MAKQLKDGQPTSLVNWRERPHSQFSFHNVQEYIRIEQIRQADAVRSLPHRVVSEGRFAEAVNTADFSEWLKELETDALIILKNGNIAFEWRAGHYQNDRPHIIFSVSKSITGLLAGQLHAKGLIDPDRGVIEYLPEAAGSGYGGCTVQQLLDMQAAIEFDESYLDKSGFYARYRIASGWNPPSELFSGDEDLKSFLLSLNGTGQAHGKVFRYLSPNSDLLGIILENASGKRFADLVSEFIFAPFGCAHTAYVTVDKAGTARSAGGICLHVHDLARIGLGILEALRTSGHSGVPPLWLQDTVHSGNRAAWQHGEFAKLLPQGNYRNQWYISGEPNDALIAIGIHGQWLYIDPRNEVVIAKLSSQAEPVDEALDIKLLEAFSQMAEAA